MTDQKAAGEVTREHRRLAVLAMIPASLHGFSNAEDRWIDNGDAAVASVQSHLPACAQAIADAEARGRAKSSVERERLKLLAFPPTKYVRGEEDGDDVCAVCRHAVCDSEEHTYRDHCIPNLEAQSNYVHDGLLELNREAADACHQRDQRIAELEADFSRMAELGNKARSLETAERDELNALLKKAAALGLKG